MKTWTKLFSAALIGMGLSSFASAANIDTFNFGNVDYTGPGATNEGPALSGTLGGNRHTDLNASGSSTRVNDPPPPVGDVTGLLSFSNDFGVAATLHLLYTGVNVDLTTGGTQNGVVFDFLSADQPATVTLALNDGIFSQSVSKVIGTGAQLLAFLFSEFPIVNAASIDQVDILITPNNTFGGDYLVDLIESREIPTPAALPAGLALLGAFALRRRVR